MSKKMKIGIIGNKGFLGSRLLSLLRGDNIKAYGYDINYPKDHLNYLDVSKPIDKSKFNSIDLIINLAAEHRDDVRPVTKYDQVNVDGARNTCNLATQLGIDRIIFTSSVAVYGFAPPETDESGECNYFNDYGRTKYLAEKVYKEWYLENPEKRSLVIIRPTVIFGEGNRGNVFNLLNQIASNRFIMIGNGKNKKSMAYVDNVAAFLKHCLSINNGMHIYNYVDKPDFDMNRLVKFTKKIIFDKNNIGPRIPSFLGISLGFMADIISMISHKPLPISVIRIKKFLGTTQFTSSYDRTGFIPPVSLEEGLERTINHEFKKLK